MPGENLSGIRLITGKRSVTNVPYETSRQGMKESEIVLGFPVDENDVPLDIHLKDYSWLPLRYWVLPVSISVGSVDLVRQGYQILKLQFFVQADFTFDAKGKDILDCAWNQKLLSGAADVFVDQVLRFCNHPTLQYSWPRFLPSAANANPFWAQLGDWIATRLSHVPILRPWNGGPLKAVGNLKRLIPICLDRNGEPLFRELAECESLSRGYLERDVRALKTIGLENISFHTISQYVEIDLNKTSSKIKNRLTSDVWHISFAELMLALVKLPSLLGTIRSFDMVPLRDGSWTSVKDGPIFHHDIAGVDIPLDLGFRLVAPEAVAHPLCRRLFDAVGVTYWSHSGIKQAIFRKYETCNDDGLLSSIREFCFQSTLELPHSDQSIETESEDNDADDDDDDDDEEEEEEGGEEEKPETAVRNQAYQASFTRSVSNSTETTTSSVSSHAAADSTAASFTQSKATTPELEDARMTSEEEEEEDCCRGSRLIDPAQIINELSEDETEYRKLFDQVIKAGKRAVFPTKPAVSAAGICGPAACATDATAHDPRLDAAGEIFALELLYRYTDRSCNLANWKSGNRGLVGVHESHHIFTPCKELDTACIVYEDQTSLLTARLIAYGYLPWEWLNQTPTYHLDVRTTAGSWDSPFFMSKPQVERMNAMQLKQGKQNQDIYVIVRVYHAASDDIGMVVLVDPATLEQKEGLLIGEESCCPALQQEDKSPRPTGGRSLRMPFVILTGTSSARDEYDSPI